MNTYTLWLSGYFPGSGYKREKVIHLYNVPLSYECAKAFIKDVYKDNPVKTCLNNRYKEYYIPKKDILSIDIDECGKDTDIARFEYLKHKLTSSDLIARDTSDCEIHRHIYDLPEKFNAVDIWTSHWRGQDYIFFKVAEFLEYAGNLRQDINRIFRDYLELRNIRIKTSLKNSDIFYITWNEDACIDVDSGFVFVDNRLILTEFIPGKKKYPYTFKQKRGNRNLKIKYTEVEL